MPVRLGSKLTSPPEARIEIVPLIDVMFFLLASFMLISLSMVNLKVLHVNLPSAASATSELSKDLATISIDKAGAAYLDKRPMESSELLAALIARHRQNPGLRVLIAGDQDARHGEILRVLDLVRGAGIDKVALEVRPTTVAK